MLQSALQHYRSQQRLHAIAIAAARHAWPRGPAALTGALMVLQKRAAQDGARSVGAALAEQGIDDAPDGEVNATALAETASDGRPLGSLLQQAETIHALELMAVTQVADAARVAAGIGIATRKGVGWTRMVNTPCCPRCALLAGKFFHWNTGFQRHPRCLCTHIPTSEDAFGDVRTDPKALFDSGKVTGVTKAEQAALDAGGDMGRIFNARRGRYIDQAGHRLTFDSTTRRGTGIKVRPTPEEIYRQAQGDQPAALRSLKKFGYIL